MFDTISVFDSMEQDNTQRRVSSRRALALAHNRVDRNLGSFLRAAQTEEEFFERLSLVQEDFDGYITTASREVGHAHPEHIAAALKDHYRLAADKVKFVETPAEEQEKEDEEGAPVTAKQAWRIVSVVPPTPSVPPMAPNAPPVPSVLEGLQGTPQGPQSPALQGANMLQGIQQPPVQQQGQSQQQLSPQQQQMLDQAQGRGTFTGKWQVVAEDKQSAPLVKAARPYQDAREPEGGPTEQSAFGAGFDNHLCKHCGQSYDAHDEAERCPVDQGYTQPFDPMAPGHMGSNEHELVTCPECGGDGKTAGATKCPKCSGKGKVVNFGDSMVDAVGADIKTADNQNNTDLGGPEPVMDKSKQTDGHPGKPDYQDGPRHPTKEKDPLKVIGPARNDHELDEIHGQDGFHKDETLPTQKGDEPFADNNMEMAPHTKTFGDKDQTDPVTREAISGADDVYKNPLSELLSSEFPSDSVVHEALLRLYK